MVAKERVGLHWLAIVVPIVVALALGLANLDGYHNHLIGDGTYFDEPPLINWAHGWPCCFLVRRSIYSLWAQFPTTPGAITGDAGMYSRWPIDDAPVIAFWIAPLLVDVAFFVLVVAGSAYGAQRLAQRLRIPNRFGLKSLFALTTLAAFTCVYGLPFIIADEYRVFVHLATFAVILLSVLLSLFATIEGLLRSRKRS